MPLPLGELSALGSAFLWALNGVLVKPLTVRMPALRITSLQYCFAALVILIIALPSGKVGEATQIPLPQVLGLIVAGIVGMGGGDTSYVRSLAILGMAKAFPLTTAGYILLAFLLAVALLGETVTLTGLVGAMVLITGIWLVVSSSSGQSEMPLGRDGTLQGLAFAGIAALCWAVSTTTLKLALVGTDVLAANVFRIPLVALLLTGANLRWYGRNFEVYDARTVAIIALAGSIGIATSSLLFLYAIREAGAAKTAVLTSSSPLFAVAMTAVFLRERVTAPVAVGTLLTVVGVWLVV